MVTDLDRRQRGRTRSKRDTPPRNSLARSGCDADGHLVLHFFAPETPFRLGSMRAMSSWPQRSVGAVLENNTLNFDGQPSSCGQERAAT
jgi:hypothetical protein